jgi:hypothetical protein
MLTKGYSATKSTLTRATNGERHVKDQEMRALAIQLAAVRHLRDR